MCVLASADGEKRSDNVRNSTGMEEVESSKNGATSVVKTYTTSVMRSILV